MSGSSFGNIFKMTTWGESHGKAVGVVIDGCPAGLPLCEEDIQKYLNRRRPGQGKYTTQRNEADIAIIQSGVFEGVTTGCPISVMIKNKDHHSADYSNIKDVFRPGHADYTFQKKYGIRDYRGGGRSSGRETIGRVCAGAVAIKLLETIGVKVKAEALEIAGVPAKTAKDRMNAAIEEKDSVGGIIGCRITGVPAGLGEPVFEKLDARLAAAMLSIGAVKGFDIGDGFAAAASSGSKNNDPFRISEKGDIIKTSNHSGGVLGGISDGSEIFFRVAIKPTPSISRPQQTVSKDGLETTIEIKGRHDPVIVPRAVVVVECMAACVIADLALINMTSKVEYFKDIYV